MGQGPASKQKCALHTHYKRAYTRIAKETPQRSLARTAQGERYLEKMAKLNDAPRVVVELRSSVSAHEDPRPSDWTVLDPNNDHASAPKIIPFTLEHWAKTHTECVDLLFSTYLLEYLDQPRAHLRAIARCLTPTGKVRIEVNNLCSFPQHFEQTFLDSQRPNVFSPHALTTMCSHAGLAPLEIDIGATITLVCRRALDHERPQVFTGPPAQHIAKRCREGSAPAAMVVAPAQSPRIWS